MEMSLIHAGLAAGTALAALPVILHLFMRQTPKHVMFPALRLIRERQTPLEEADADQELAAAAGADGRAGPDGPGPGAAADLLAGAPGRRVGADGAGPGLRHQPVDEIQGQGQDPARRGQGAGQGDLDKLPDSSLVFVVDSAEPGMPIGLSPAAALSGSTA